MQYAIGYSCFDHAHRQENFDILVWACWVTLSKKHPILVITCVHLHVYIYYTRILC